MSDPLAGLNPPQREAVLHGDGPLLVLAGAGSGKTRVLTHRVARLVGEAGVPADAILAITFTNKAAGEMRERIARLVGPRARAIWASTFHSACVRILRRDAESAGYARDFSIYDADDQLRLIRRCLTEDEVDPKRVPPRAVQARISDAKSRLQTPEEVEALTGSFHDEIVARAYRRYADALRANGAMDFDDLLMVTAQLLEGDEEVRSRWQSRFQHVLVDEYQDTNHAQYRLVRALGEPQRNVVAVGDDDQGIYSWRGADVNNILDFERDYPDARVVALEQNYRSTGTILRAANAVVSQNPHRHPKHLWTDLGDGEPILVVACRDEHEEARVVADQIDGALARGSSLSEVAVFYRTNAQSRAIEDQLVRRQVPYVVVGGPRFYERAEVRDLLAYLRAVANPADGVSMARMLGAPKRGLGPGAIGKLEAFAATHGLPVVDSLGHAEVVPGLQPAQRAAVTDAGALVADARVMVEAGSPLDQVLETVLERSGLRDALVREGTFEAQGRVENLEEMVRVAAEYVGSEDDASLAGFLEGIALQADADLVRRRRRRGDPHDHPQRQGPGIRHRGDHRAGGGALPARAIRHPGDPPGGAPALLRGPHAGPPPPGAQPRREPRHARRPRLPSPVALPGRAAGRRPGRAARRATLGRRRREHAVAGDPRPRAGHRRLGAARHLRRGRGDGDRERRGAGAGALRAGRRRAPPDGRRRPDEEGGVAPVLRPGGPS